MNAPAALAAPSFPLVEHPDDEMSLAAMLDLFEHEDPADSPSSERTPGRPGTALRTWVREWVRRAAEWGSGPRGSRRAW